MNYWLESTYPSKREENDFTNFLISPIRSKGNKDIYSNMRRVKPNDIIFHLDQDKKSIIGYSYAASNYIIYEIEDEQYYLIDLVNYQNLKITIDVDTFLNNPQYKEQLKRIKANHEVFFQERNNKYYIKQGGYLTALSEELIHLFNSNLKKIDNFDNFNNFDEENFPEGNTIYKIHKSKERSSKVIKLAKQRFKAKHNNELFCECCNFHFTKTYGEIGHDFIEGHHIQPISDIEDERLTKIDDIILLCSNCHRMIHRKRPWLTVDKLKTLLKK